MPYCEQCNASCEVKDVEPTPSPHMQQGNCTRCNHRVFFFTDIPLEAATPADSSSVTPEKPTPRTAAPAAPTLDEASPPPDLLLPLREWLTPTRRYILGGISAIVLLLIIIFSLIAQFSTPAEPLSAVAQVDAPTGCITVTNNNSFNWANVKLTLNDRYVMQTPTPSFPSRGTVHFAFSNFKDGSGHAFNPAGTTPSHVTIEAKDVNGHTENLDVDVK